MSEESDEALVRRCRAGERQAFEGLVLRYQRQVYNLALRMLRHPEDARDVAQTTFLKAWEHLGSFDPGMRFFSWLYRIAVNECINAGRRLRPSQELSGEEADGAAGPEDALDGGQFDRALQEAIMGLSPDYRAVIVLCHVSGLSYEEMAGVLEVPAKTVKSRLFSARQRLRESPALAAWVEAT